MFFTKNKIDAEMFSVKNISMSSRLCGLIFWHDLTGQFPNSKFSVYFPVLFCIIMSEIDIFRICLWGREDSSPNWAYLARRTNEKGI